MQKPAPKSSSRNPSPTDSATTADGDRRAESWCLGCLGERRITQETDHGKPKSPAKMRATALKDLDAIQKRELLKTIMRRVELTPNSIILNPFEGETIVGEVKEREGIRSGRWRFIEVEWLN